MKFFQKKDKSAMAEASMRELRNEVSDGFKFYGKRTLYDGDGGVVREYDETLVFFDFILVNNAAIAMGDIDLYRYSAWTGLALNPQWWPEQDVNAKAKAWFDQTVENMILRERFADPGFAELKEAISNLSGALMALLQSFDDFDEILKVKAANGIKWATEKN